MKLHLETLMNTITDSIETASMDELLDLSDSLARLKLLHDRDIKTKEYEHTPFPLASLLSIHYKACINQSYWADRVMTFKVLVEWLAPITYTSDGMLNMFMLSVFSPNELSEMEYWAGDGISEKDIIECTVLNFIKNNRDK